MTPLRKLPGSHAGIKASEVRLVGHPGDELSRYAKKLDVLAMNL